MNSNDTYTNIEKVLGSVLGIFSVAILALIALSAMAL